MAWTSPRTWVAGETVTAVLLNTHVRDNLNAVVRHNDGVGRRIATGTGTVTWDGTSSLSPATTISHGLGAVPTGVWLATRQRGVTEPVWDSEDSTWTTTQFNVVAFHATGATPANGSSANFSWLAITT